MNFSWQLHLCCWVVGAAIVLPYYEPSDPLRQPGMFALFIGPLHMKLVWRK